MKNLTVENIARACHGEIVCHNASINADTEAAGVVIDSRLVCEGYVFVASKGEKVDGHRFIPDVLAKGALAVICQEVPDVFDGICIKVKDSFEALRDIAEYYRQQISATVVGITGSVGKTSTKEMVASVLSENFDVLKTKGNLNNQIGLPLTVLSIEEHHQVAVLEMGINQFGEMTRLSKIARPDICVITNIGECHLEFLGDRDGVLRAKTEIFEYMSDDGYAVINADDDKLVNVGTVKGKTPVGFGLENVSAQCYAHDIEDRGLLGSTCSIKYNNEKDMDVEILLPGRHMVYNAAAATAVARILGMSHEDICRGISHTQGVQGRSNVIKKDDIIVVDDCYNANPTSVKTALDMLAGVKGRKVAILGDMFELGAEENALHASVGAYAATKNIDLTICIGGLSKYMYDAAGKNALYFADLETAMPEIKGLIKNGDTVLIKASHSMQFEKIVKLLTE